MDLQVFSDAQLMVLYQHGREDAFELLFERHWRRVYRVAWRMTGQEQEAEEVVQEVFLKIVGATASYKPSASAAWTTWLHRIVVNTCLNRVTRGASGRVVPLSLARDLEESQASLEDDPARCLEARQAQEVLHRGLMALAPAWRAALVMRVFEGQSYAEVGEALSIPEGTAKTYVHRARVALRRRVEPGAGEES